jgi:hypothetical protein
MTTDPLLLPGPDDPMFFTLLDEEDRKKYRELQGILRHSEKRYKRNKRLEGLQDALDAIQEFAIRRQPDDWKRSLVCGVCWIGQDIAINIRQLKLLVNKCKSSINGALSKMGYGTSAINAPLAPSLLSYIPFLKGNFIEQRQWTVRRRVHMSPMPFRSSFPTPLLVSPTTPSFNSPDPPTPLPPCASGPGDDLALFGFADLAKESGFPDPHDGYDFILDPCCCCPIQWQRPHEAADDLFKFA